MDNVEVQKRLNIIESVEEAMELTVMDSPALGVLQEALFNEDNTDLLMVENELDEFAEHFGKVVRAFRDVKLKSLKTK